MRCATQKRILHFPHAMSTSPRRFRQQEHFLEFGLLSVSISGTWSIVGAGPRMGDASIFSILLMSYTTRAGQIFHWSYEMVL